MSFPIGLAVKAADLRTTDMTTMSTNTNNDNERLFALVCAYIASGKPAMDAYTLASATIKEYGTPNNWAAKPGARAARDAKAERIDKLENDAAAAPVGVPSVEELNAWWRKAMSTEGDSMGRFHTYLLTRTSAAKVPVPVTFGMMNQWFAEASDCGHTDMAWLAQCVNKHIGAGEITREQFRQATEAFYAESGNLAQYHDLIAFLASLGIKVKE